MKLLRPLLNPGGSKDMNVNGAPPKTFSFTPLKELRLCGLQICMIDEGASTATKFGAITALTNGILIQTVINNVTSTVATIRDNGDLSTIFKRPYFGSGAVLSILGNITPVGFLSTNNAFIAELDLRSKDDSDIILLPGDLVQVVIRDDLTGIEFLRLTAELETP